MWALGCRHIGAGLLGAGLVLRLDPCALRTHLFEQNAFVGLQFEADHKAAGGPHLPEHPQHFGHLGKVEGQGPIGALDFVLGLEQEKTRFSGGTDWGDSSW